jgi:hypothetical protein
MHRALSALMPGLMLVVTAGCFGGGGGAEFPTTPVTLKVMYKGSPVEGANIAMVNANDYDKPVIAVGRTNAQGEAVMRTYSDGDGAVKGTHLVTVTKMEVAAGGPVAETESPDYDPNAPVSSAPKSLLPIKYSTPASGLTVQVGESPVVQTLELEG